MRGTLGEAPLDGIYVQYEPGTTTRTTNTLKPYLFIEPFAF